MEGSLGRVPYCTPFKQERRPQLNCCASQFLFESRLDTGLRSPSPCGTRIALLGSVRGQQACTCCWADSQALGTWETLQALLVADVAQLLVSCRGEAVWSCLKMGLTGKPRLVLARHLSRAFVASARCWSRFIIASQSTAAPLTFCRCRVPEFLGSAPLL